MKLTLIANIDDNFGLGFKNDLLYKIPSDMKFFKKITSLGKFNVIIMGRKTFESIGNTPLPNRVNIILSSKTDHAIPKEYAESLVYYNSISTILTWLESTRLSYNVNKEDFNVCVIGGSQVYERFLPMGTNLALCRVYANDKEADTWFPKIDFEDWDLISETDRVLDPFYNKEFNFVEYKRK